MSRDADILFCKIAITAGMVSQEQAQKVLAFLDRREREAGRRPLVGAVFAKHQLLSPQQVQKVNAAVTKRRGDAAVVTRSAPTPRGEAGRARKRQGRKSSKRPVDQQTLIMGSGYGVVFVGVLIALCYLFVVKSPGGGPSASTRAVTNGSLAGSGLASPSGREVSTAPPVETEKELDRQHLHNFNSSLGDILTDRIDDPRRARRSLGDLKSYIQGLRDQGYTIPANVEERLSDVESSLAALEAEPQRDDPASEDKGATPAAAAPDAAKPKTEESDSEKADDADDLDLDDLDDLDDL